MYKVINMWPELFKKLMSCFYFSEITSSPVKVKSNEYWLIDCEGAIVEERKKFFVSIDGLKFDLTTFYKRYLLAKGTGKNSPRYGRELFSHIGNGEYVFDFYPIE